mmetsp:Transcript_14703/g.37029  ORF Transcript_14703/g.37029 Transcript_14703/m.37029 type:complete len:210 (-) Transcript_14703:22-651(-)
MTVRAANSMMPGSTSRLAGTQPCADLRGMEVLARAPDESSMPRPRCPTSTTSDSLLRFRQGSRAINSITSGSNFRSVITWFLRCDGCSDGGTVLKYERPRSVSFGSKRTIASEDHPGCATQTAASISARRASTDGFCEGLSSKVSLSTFVLPLNVSKIKSSSPSSKLPGSSGGCCCSCCPSCSSCRCSCRCSCSCSCCDFGCSCWSSCC